MNFWKNPAKALLDKWRQKFIPTLHTLNFYSTQLDRDVRLDIYLPSNYKAASQRVYPLMLFNDGQDLPRMDSDETGFQGILTQLFASHKIPPIIAVGIYTSNQRMREYGTVRQADYKGRGDMAANYSRFILEELQPYLFRHYQLSDRPADCAIAGFSLGGLSAFDIGWANPQRFGCIGVFSGALWWRWAPVNPADPDADRIAHDIVTQSSNIDKNQRFWFQCGTLDEEDDRNHNGIIDSIDDTQDLIKAIRSKGFQADSIRYLEVEDGRHDPHTWGKAMGDFLAWAFSKPTLNT